MAWHSPVTISRSNSSSTIYLQFCCTQASSGRRTRATPRAKCLGRAGSTLSASPTHPNNVTAMVYLTRKLEFSASHLYHNPALSAEENRRIFGKCNNPHGHGHNYTLEVTIAGEPDPVTGMVLDLKELKEILEREITQRMDHRFLNYEVAELRDQIPTCENVARVIWNLLEPKIPQGHLHRVRLHESSDLFADCYRNGSKGTVCWRISCTLSSAAGII